MILSDIANIGKWSKKLIKLKCDHCDIEREMSMKSYTSYGYENGEYLCRQCKLESNNLKKYGVKNIFELESIKNKIRDTNLKKYNVDNPSKSPMIKEKIKSSLKDLDYSKVNEKRKITTREKYGVDNISQLESIKRDKENTCIKNNGEKYIFETDNFKDYITKFNKSKYGVKHIFQSKEIKENIKLTNLRKYGYSNPSKSPMIKDKIRKSIKNTLHRKMYNNIENLKSIDDNLTILCELCENEFRINPILFYKRREYETEICTICNPIDKHISGKEISLFNYIKSIYDGKVIQGYRDGLEIDIYLPDLEIGFEFNGMYWHSTKFKDKYYHNRKSLYFKNKGIEVIHIWEVDWDSDINKIKKDIAYLISNSSKIDITIKEPILYLYTNEELYESNDIILSENSIYIWK